MKIVCFTPDKIGEQYAYYVKPDNCLLRNNNDFYIPNHTKKVEATLNIVLKINKIGKSIQPKFADRYFNEIGVGINFYATDIEKILENSNIPKDLAYSFDFSSAICKDLIDLEKINISDIHIELFINQNFIKKASLYSLLICLSECVSTYSQYSTLKIGDYIFKTVDDKRFSLHIGDKVQVLLNKKNVLEFDIK